MHTLLHTQTHGHARTRAHTHTHVHRDSFQSQFTEREGEINKD